VTIFIGLDPGASGGIAWVNGGRMEALPWGETERDTAEQIWSLQAQTPDCFAVIEDCHSMPGQGVSSSFKFGRHLGFLRGCLISLGIPFESVSPSKWQKAMGCMTRGNKNVSKRRAQELFPHLKITHRVADAVLLAEYCRITRARTLAAEAKQ